jgi:hypothetical protein
VRGVDKSNDLCTMEICISLDTYACSIDTALPCNRSTLHFGIFALFTVPKNLGRVQGLGAYSLP